MNILSTCTKHIIHMPTTLLISKIQIYIADDIAYLSCCTYFNYVIFRYMLLNIIDYNMIAIYYDNRYEIDNHYTKH